MVPFSALPARRSFQPPDGAFRQLGSKGFVTHLRPTDASRPGQTMVQVTRGSQNRKGAEGKAEASQTPGAAMAPKQCRDERAGQGTRPKRIPTLLVAAAV